MNRRAILFAGLLVIGLAGNAFPSGWDNSCIGSRAAAMGSAFVGLADDATAVFYNQAGLAFIEAEGEIWLGYKVYFPKFTYVGQTGGEVVSDRVSNLFEGFGYYRVNDRLVLGMGVYTPYAGGGMKWPKEELGIGLEAYMGSFSFSPAVAFKVNDYLSVGGSVSAIYFISEVKSDNPFMTPSRIDAKETDYAIAFSASVFVKPNEKWSFGATFRSPVDVRVEGTSTIDGAELDSETEFNLPYIVSVGAAFKVNPRLTVVADVDYFNWDKLQHADKTIHYPDPIGDQTFREELGFEDSYQIEAGAEYDISGEISCQIGVNYDVGAVPEESLSLTNIDVASLSIFGGISYRRGGYTFSVSGFDALGEAKAVQAVPSGTNEYDRDSLALLLSLSRTF